MKVSSASNSRAMDFAFGQLKDCLSAGGQSPNLIRLIAGLTHSDSGAAISFAAI
jgi:hypothetical protein